MVYRWRTTVHFVSTLLSDERLRLVAAFLLGAIVTFPFRFESRKTAVEVEEVKTQIENAALELLREHGKEQNLQAVYRLAP